MKLEQLRRNKGLTQKQLSLKLGVSQQAISFYEKGKKRPTYEIIQKLSFYLDCSINDILNMFIKK